MVASRSSRWGTIVVGLGGMGSAACYHLARRGVDVLGLDQGRPGHARCASAGGVRAFRMAYFQNDDFVALARQAEVLWQELHDSVEARLFEPRGALLIAPEDHPVVDGVLGAARRHGLDVDLLTREQCKARAPGLRPRPGDVVLWERRAGVLWSLRCDAAHRRLAARAGAVLRGDQPVLSIEAVADGVCVHTPHARHLADHVVVTTGAWLSRGGGGCGDDLLGWRSPVCVLRQVQVDLPLDPSQTEAWSRVAAWNIAVDGSRRSFYGTGSLNRGFLTFGQHMGGAPVAVGDDRPALATELGALREVAERFMPRLKFRPVSTRVGRYACTPDLAPVLGLHPSDPRVVICGGFSGHGYKFASAVGRVVAELVIEGRSRAPLRSFDPGRSFPNAPAGEAT